MAWPAKVRRWRGKARPGTVWHGLVKARRGEGQACSGLAGWRHAAARRGVVGLVRAWLGKARSGLIGHGMARQGEMISNTVAIGLAQAIERNCDRFLHGEIR